MRRTKRRKRSRRRNPMDATIPLPRGFKRYVVKVEGFPDWEIVAKDVKMAKAKWWTRWKPPFLTVPLKVKKAKFQGGWR